MTSKDRTYSENLGKDCDAATAADKARRKARDDFRAGCGQDDNPYDRAQQTALYEAYAWEMGKLWNQDFQAAQAQRSKDHD